MPSASSRIALFIDGANLHATARTLGFDIDYKRLLAEFSSRGAVLRAFYYSAMDPELSSLRPLLDWLDYNGYTVVTRPTRESDRRWRPPQGQRQSGDRARGRRDGTRR